ncbi:hypothetical protein DM02DRAFT_616772 [Periconia macrospinosa]|uniref:Uncharacterized protein n=1 Tax=Periconia macrospinosa TaxID=97972 RepID=A0A2V1DIL3_9PLEO|nr:hypothetical protein DM02DRAFT_616772 [Periconia macrospinosa]
MATMAHPHARSHGTPSGTSHPPHPSIQTPFPRSVTSHTLTHTHTSVITLNQVTHPVLTHTRRRWQLSE